MQVNDLYLILRELKQIATLQANLADLLSTDPSMKNAYDAQKQAEYQLNTIMEDYDRYTI
jgi:hypothetical protein